jgi:xylose isomerase
MILKDKVSIWNADKEIQAIVSEISADDGSMDQYFGKYSTDKAAALKSVAFDREAIAKRGMKYERLDQLTIDVLLGAR